MAKSGFFWLRLPYYAGALLLAIAGILVLIVPALLYYQYFNQYGKKKDFHVPEYLSFLRPHPRNPGS